MLHIKNLRIDLAGQTIIEHINLDLAAGQSLALSGASGSGKTTLLRAIAGLNEPQEGHIDCQAKRLAYLYQEPRLLPWLRADENIRLVAPDASDERIYQLLADLWLERKDARKYPHELSGGMQQRIALARALITDPDLLLMDEPFSALDARLRDELQQRVIRIIEGGTSVVLVTHDAQEAVRLAQHIYCLGGGKPAGIFAEIHLPDPFQQRDHAWCQEKSAHPALRGIEEAALAD
jgi:ABC superfamily ATP binding cassette transporter, ABC protein